MKKKILVLFSCFLILGFFSCSNSVPGPDTTKTKPGNTTSSGSNKPIPNSYSQSFTVGGYYVCYDGLHYKYVCSSVDDVKAIIKYYYPDCFDVKVYKPGTEQTGYLNTIFYATWKSYY